MTNVLENGASGDLVRVGIADDDATFAREVAGWVDGTPGFSVVAQNTTAEEALQVWPRLKLRLAVVDLQLPAMGGIKLIRQVKRRLPDLTCVVLTQFEDSDLLFAAVAAGADSYLLKHDSRSRILDGLKDAHAGGSVVSPSLGRRLFDFFQAPGVTAAVRAALTSRQIDILQLARRGRNAKQIASVLGLSSETVRTHFRNIYRALQVHSLDQAVDRAFPDHR
jgi:DNA-binding NarL/FixJ family response regulator